METNQGRHEGEQKKSRLKMFLNFLLYGGWLVIIVVVLGLIILFSTISES